MDEIMIHGYSRDFDESAEFYRRLGFVVRDDGILGSGERVVLLIHASVPGFILHLSSFPANLWLTLPSAEFPGSKAPLFTLLSSRWNDWIDRLKGTETVFKVMMGKPYDTWLTFNDPSGNLIQVICEESFRSPNQTVSSASRSLSSNGDRVLIELHAADVEIGARFYRQLGFVDEPGPVGIFGLQIATMIHRECPAVVLLIRRAIHLLTYSRAIGTNGFAASSRRRFQVVCEDYFAWRKLLESGGIPFEVVSLPFAIWFYAQDMNGNHFCVTTSDQI